MKHKPVGIVLFSGGLDSILTARILESQGLEILCAHFYSPFFGADNPAKWHDIYGLNIECHDVSRDIAEILVKGPHHGFGKTVNPCVDCKILLLSRARQLLETTGARFLATGEVLGQRPMSQRRDSMDVIRKEASVDGLLLRPLCARLYKPTIFEEDGLVNREALYDFSGRNRTPQLELAKKLGIREIPSPAGGCLLTELENGRRYWPIILKWRERRTDWKACVEDFRLAKVGRQFWRNTGEHPVWLCIGRQQADNASLLESRREDDVTLKLSGCPGPLVLCREGAGWPKVFIREAAELLCAHSPRARNQGGLINVSVLGKDRRELIRVEPKKHEELWTLPGWDETRQAMKNFHKETWSKFS